MIDKVEEELSEVKEAISENNPEHIEEEVGDLLFSIVNLSRFLKLDTENVLHKTIYKFVERFKKMEMALASMGKDIEKCTLEEMDAIWNKVKKRKRLQNGDNARGIGEGWRRPFWRVLLLAYWVQIHTPLALRRLVLEFTYVNLPPPDFRAD